MRRISFHLITDPGELKKGSLSKLIETTSRKSKFQQASDENPSSKPLLGSPSQILSLRCQQPCQNLSFKSLPPLGAKDSLENIIRIRRYSEFPRRNLLRSFVKANSLEKRPRRRLCLIKDKAARESNEHIDTLKSKIYPEVNARKLQYQLAKEKKVFNRSCIGRFGQSIRNRIKGEALVGRFGNALNQGLSYEEVEDDANNLEISSNDSKASRASCCTDVGSARHKSGLPANKGSKFSTTPNDSYSVMEMLHSLEQLNLNRGMCEAIVRRKSLETSHQTPCDKPLFKKNDLSTWCDERVDRTNFLKEYKKKCGLNFQELNEIDCRTVNYPMMEVAKDNSFIDLQSCPSRVDFSSGDDTRNLTLKLPLDEPESVCEMTGGEERREQDYESRRRSVQWNSEVDVIYYAGDTDGGKVIRRKMEPLREETDQQARRNGFIKWTLNKNLISAFNTYKFRDPWVTVYHK